MLIFLVNSHTAPPIAPLYFAQYDLYQSIIKLLIIPKLDGR